MPLLVIPGNACIVVIPQVLIAGIFNLGGRLVLPDGILVELEQPRESMPARRCFNALAYRAKPFRPIVYTLRLMNSYHDMHNVRAVQNCHVFG